MHSKKLRNSEALSVIVALVEKFAYEPEEKLNNEIS